MKFLVTGLCLQGNKGGPALALSLTRQLQSHFPGAEFVFSVPAGFEFDRERLWARKYGFQVVETFSFRDLIPPKCFFGSPPRFARILKWVRILARVDAVVEMSAITYVGPPARHQLNALLGGRFAYFVASRVLDKPLVAWTQSYGPFSTRLVRFLAKLDLKRQPIIFCRGENALKAVRELLPEKRALSFPDVAVTLPYDRIRGDELIRSIDGSLNPSHVVTISPSAVLYEKGDRGKTTNRHIDLVTAAVRHLHRKGYAVLMVPHTYRPGTSNPRRCDHAVAVIAAEAVRGSGVLRIVDDDLSPIELKSIISAGAMHIGGRYHSVVAALSSGTPCISMSWHPKYRDIMKMYGMERFVFEDSGSESHGRLSALLDQLEESAATLRTELGSHQARLAREVQENAALFADTLRTGLSAATQMEEVRR